jgi:hypothetical protein
MVCGVRIILLNIDKVNCVACNETFGMECAGDEPRDASPIPFRLWEYGTSAYGG